MRRIIATMAIMVIACVGLTGCSSDEDLLSKVSSQVTAQSFDNSTPQKAVEGFLSALGQADTAEALKYVNPSDRPEGGFVSKKVLAKGKGLVSDIHVGETGSYDGANAVEVSFKAAGENVKAAVAVENSGDGKYLICKDESDEGKVLDMDDLMPSVDDHADKQQSLHVIPGQFQIDTHADWGAVPQIVTVVGNGDPITTEYGKITITDKDAFDNALKTMMVNTLSDWVDENTDEYSDEDDEESSPSYDPDGLTMNVGEVKQAPNAPGLVVFDASGQFPDSTAPNGMRTIGDDGRFVVTIDQLLSPDQTNNWNVQYLMGDIDDLTEEDMTGQYHHVDYPVNNDDGTVSF